MEKERARCTAGLVLRVGIMEKSGVGGIVYSLHEIGLRKYAIQMAMIIPLYHASLAK